MRVTFWSLIIALLVLLGLLSGCSDKKPEAPTKPHAHNHSSSPTTKPNGTPSTSPTKPSNPPASEPGRENLNVEHDHKGLHMKLDSSYSVGLKDDDKNTFTFSNDKISGTIAFGKLSTLVPSNLNTQENDKLTGTAKDKKYSEDYAKLVRDQHSEDNAWIGSSTGTTFYVVYTAEGTTTIECLYVYGEYAWLVKAQSSAADTANAMVHIVGRCSLYADEIPVE